MNPGSPRIASVWVDVDRYRWLSTLVALGALAAVGLAVFGLPPVRVPDPLHWLGVMGPTCGMTRAVRQLALGELGEALRYNPASPLVPGFGLAVMARALHGRRTGRWFEVQVRWRWVPMLLCGAALLVLTVNQQLNAELIR